jgi:hypothetical protein
LKVSEGGEQGEIDERRDRGSEADIEERERLR